jgi:DNA (cytosine-5)-methyltransferase 1
MGKEYTFVDLFAGCGGFSEGFYMEGFKALCHVEIDKNACNTLEERMRYYNYSEEEIKKGVISNDITNPKIVDQIKQATEDLEVDVLVGGPPCQSFSSVGRAQDPKSMKFDKRNYLFENYIQILNHFKPKVFVFENVTGLLNAKPNGEYILDSIFEKMQQSYNISTDKKEIVLNSVHYGVPQIRKRVILIGVRKDLGTSASEIYKNIRKTHYAPKEQDKFDLHKYLTVKDAIFDLPKLFPGQGEEEIEFQPTNWNAYLEKIRDKNFPTLYNHVARRHNEKDRERYRILSENNWQLKNLADVRPDLIHHDPKHFGNRYTVQSKELPGRTVVAHLYKDGNLFIHPDPTQERTFTVREAARIQSFPDDFKFIGSRTHQYKQVGNAVPPLMAKQIAKAIIGFLDERTNIKCIGRHQMLVK